MPPPRPARSSKARAARAARSPSIYEVARLADVSVATVSRVLNGKGPVRSTTQQRVLAAVSELGYVPHGAARSLSTRRTMLIGVLLPDMHGAFFSEIVRGIDRAARAAGYHLLVSGSHDDPLETEQVLQALHGRVDGLILMAPGLSSTWLDARLPRQLPLVLLNPRRAEGPESGHAAIRIANRRGARLAVEHLVALGHRQIAFVAGPSGNSDAEERWRGYEEELRHRRIAPQDHLQLAGDFSEESGARAGAAVAELAPRPTAVFAANDAMAVGCIAALRERQLHVPADVSVVGFDDIPIARYVTPPLTTVHVPIAELGTRAMERLLDLMDGKEERELRQDTVATSLVVRASSAAAPS